MKLVGYLFGRKLTTPIINLLMDGRTKICWANFVLILSLAINCSPLFYMRLKLNFIMSVKSGTMYRK